MTATNDWTFDGQLESTDTIPATADQERAKIAALFGKGTVGTAQSDNIDYQAAFEEHKKAEQAQPNLTSSKEAVALSSTEDDITSSYKSHLTQTLAGHEQELVHVRVELERLQELVTSKEKTIKTIKAILSAIDSLA